MFDVALILAQRYAATLADDAFNGLWRLAETPGEWRDDLAVRYRREVR
jgi:hypothetical protein